MKRYDTHTMLEILGDLQKETGTKHPGETVQIIVSHPDLKGGYFEGALLEREGTRNQTFRVRSLRVWCDLAEVLGARNDLLARTLKTDGES